jgi:transposase-like protein
MSPTRHPPAEPATPIPDEINRIGDSTLRGKALEAYEAAGRLEDSINFWIFGGMLLQGQAEFPVGNARRPRRRLSTWEFCESERVVREAVATLYAHAANVLPFRGRPAAEVLSWFPAAPSGTVSQESDAEFIQRVTSEQTRKRLLDLRSDLLGFIERVSRAPLSVLAAGATASNDQKHAPSRRIRRRKSDRKPRPLTPKQAEAVQLVSEHKGNVAAAARAAGVSRSVMYRQYEAGMKKLAKAGSNPKVKTVPLPQDRRGQASVDRDARRG